MTATEMELLACLGAEPQLLCDEVPWAYNEAVYQVEVDGLAISFVVAPATRDVRLIARRGERRVFELCAVGVADVRVDDERGVDAIKVQLSAGSWVRVQLRPTFEVMQGFEPQGRTMRYT